MYKKKTKTKQKQKKQNKTKLVNSFLWKPINQRNNRWKQKGKEGKQLNMEAATTTLSKQCNQYTADVQQYRATAKY